VVQERFHNLLALLNTEQGGFFLKEKATQLQSLRGAAIAKPL
jgi:hypothetical protein